VERIAPTLTSSPRLSSKCLCCCFSLASSLAFLIGWFLYDFLRNGRVLVSLTWLYKVGFQPEAEKFGIFLGLMVTYLTVTSSFFIMIAAFAPNLQIATIVAPGKVYPSLRLTSFLMCEMQYVPCCSSCLVAIMSTTTVFPCTMYG